MSFRTRPTTHLHRRILVPAATGAILAAGLLVLTNVTTTASGAEQAPISSTRPAVSAPARGAELTSGRDHFVGVTSPVSRRAAHPAAAPRSRAATPRRHSHPTAPRRAEHRAAGHRAAGHRAAPVVRPTSPTTAPAATTTTTTTPPTTAASGYGCSNAMAYLQAHAAAGFTFECPGYALGHQAMTCIDVAGVCSGEHLIVINDPCPAAYMNEASNSKVLEGLASAPIDPYGSCSD
jgi:hypothetical protein